MDKVKYFKISSSAVSFISKLYCNDMMDKSVPFIIETFCLGLIQKY